MPPSGVNLSAFERRLTTTFSSLSRSRRRRTPGSLDAVGLEAEVDAPALGVGGEGASDPAQECERAGGADVQAEATRLQLGEVQELPDQAEQALGVLAHHPQALARHRHRVDVRLAFQEAVERAEDEGQRRAELVGEVGEEAGADLEEARVLLPLLVDGAGLEEVAPRVALELVAGEHADEVGRAEEDERADERPRRRLLDRERHDHERRRDQPAHDGGVDEAEAEEDVRRQDDQHRGRCSSSRPTCRGRA